MSDSHEVVTTTEGARAILDLEVGEVMHPVVGPLVESRDLYVRPSRLAERLDEPGEEPLVLLDVGLGAGSNALAALQVSEARSRPSRRLHIISFDRTGAALELALRPEHAADFGFEGSCAVAAAELLASGRHETEATSWEFVLGELPASLACPHPADIVYWDLYSPRSNPEMWSAEVFTSLRALCGPRATLHTYTAATSNRAALLLGGFAVGVGVSSAQKGKKGRTTIAASRHEDLEHPLGERWLARLGRSSAPFPPDAPPDAMSRIERMPQFRETSAPPQPSMG